LHALTQRNGPVLPTWRLGWARCWGFVLRAVCPCFCPTSPADKRQQSFVCLTPHSLRRRLGPFRPPNTAHPTTNDRRRRRPTNCHATAQLNPTTANPIPHRLLQHITCSPNTACCSREQTSTTSRPDLPCSYHHRHITAPAPAANRQTTIDVHKHPPMYA
jgi:hypothetical protein